MNFNSVKQLTDTDLQAVNKLIHYNLSSDVALINQLSHHIIQSGGKRLRPLIVILTAKALGYQGKHHYQLAAIIEFIHTATLLHDDVVDASSMRRGRATANALWGNEASVLVGDFLYSRSFEMMVEIQNMQVMNVLSTTTNKIAEGEVLQLMNCNNPDTTEKQYMKVIKRKTAQLFMAGAQLGGIIASASTEQENHLKQYGLNLGIAFQLIDDVMDYSANADEMGKNIGDDLAEGKPTLPLIHALKNGNNDQQQIIKNAILNGDINQMSEIIQIIQQTKAIDYTFDIAKQAVNTALDSLKTLPDTPYRDALISLTHYAIQRTH